MRLKEPGQEFMYGSQIFTVGGFASTPVENTQRKYGIIQELDTEETPCPAALCDFGREDLQRLPLTGMTPLMTCSPAETGQMYVLYYFCDGSEGPQAKVLGISASKDALVCLMLENVKDTTLTFRSGYAHQESDSLWFEFDDNEPPCQIYLCYNIEPVPVCSEAKGGTAI